MDVRLRNGSPLRVENIYCIGRNYAKHAQELGNPVLERPLVFLKSTAALRGLNQPEFQPFVTETFHFEAELVLAIGRDIASQEAPAITDIAGIGLGIDLTRREEQNRIKKDGHPWTLAKSFAGSAVLGELLKRDDVATDESTLNALNFNFSLNGHEKQKGMIKDMIVKPIGLLSYIHSFSPLKTGDLLFTGTPEGVGPIVRGDGFALTLNAGSRELAVWTGVL